MLAKLLKFSVSRGFHSLDHVMTWDDSEICAFWIVPYFDPKHKSYIKSLAVFTLIVLIVIRS